MTINVALVTNEAVILGSDSVASTTRYFLDPTKVIPRDEGGNWIVDADGNWNAKFGFGDLTSIVTNAWGGVTKMFPLCGSASDSHTVVAAITSGLANLKDRTMNSFAGEFHKAIANANPEVETVQDVVDRFVEFMAAHYIDHYGDTSEPEELRDDIEFLIGGYGRTDALPSLYRVKLKTTEKEMVYAPTIPDKTGLAWAGQSTSVQRILRGHDGMLRYELSQEFDKLYTSMSKSMLRIVQDLLQVLGADIPENVDTNLPGKPSLDPIFKRYSLDIDYQNIPLQDAIDFVAYLVNLESGKQHFVRGGANCWRPYAHLCDHAQ